MAVFNLILGNIFLEQPAKRCLVSALRSAVRKLAWFLSPLEPDSFSTQAAVAVSPKEELNI